MHRIPALESARGVAALAVVFVHILMMLRPEWQHARHAAGWGWWAAETPLQGVLGGRVPVRFFFVLSGFVLSLPYFLRPDTRVLTSAAARRYPRLVIPVCFAVAFAYLLMVTVGMHGQEAARVLRHSGDWFSLFYDFQPTPRSAVKEALFDAWFRYGRFPRYDGVLWTMSLEFSGSMLVFASLALFGRVRNRWLFYVAGSLVLHALPKAMLVDFVAGMAVADVYARRSNFRLPAAGGWLAILAGLALGGCRRDWPGFRSLPYGEYWETAGAAMILAAILYCPHVRRALEVGVLRWLGAISFPLYLLHWPIIFSVGCLTLVRCIGAGFAELPAGLIAGGVSVALSLAIASFPGLWAERLAIDLPKAMYRKFFDPETPSREAARVDAAEPVVALREGG